VHKLRSSVTNVAAKLRQAFDDMMTSRVKSRAVDTVDNDSSVTPRLQPTPTQQPDLKNYNHMN